VDGCGRLWTVVDGFPTLLDVCGHLWTLVDTYFRFWLYISGFGHGFRFQITGFGFSRGGGGSRNGRGGVRCEVFLHLRKVKDLEGNTCFPDDY
jgi:hypothetical protein